MRTARKLFWAVVPFVAACSSVEVHTDYDSAADFSRYNTYYWAKTPTTRNPLMAERIVAEIDGQLFAKGWKRVAEGQGDAAIASHVTTREQERIDTMYNNMGPGWYGPAGGMGGWGYAGTGMSTSTVSYYTVGTLIVDILDTKSHKAIWHGTAEGTVDNDAQDMKKEFHEAAQKMFKDFPPFRATSNPPR